MKKRFSHLSKADQEKVELEYHQMDPHEFDESMARAKTHAPASIRLPADLVASLKVIAELEGEPGYQALVRKWIEERLQHEARLVLRLSEMPVKEVAMVLKRRVTKG